MAKSRLLDGLRPGSLALSATFVDSLFPLAVAITLTDHNPLIFGSGLVTGLGVGSAISAVIFCKPILVATINSPRVLARHLAKPSFVMSALGRLELTMFVVAVTFVGVTIPTLIRGLIPIAYMLVLQKSMSSNRYLPIKIWAGLPLFLAVAGVALVVVSRPSQIVIGDWWPLVAGVALSLASVVAASMTAFHLIWGAKYSQEVVPGSGRESEVAASLLGTVLVSVLAVPILALAGLLLGGPVTWSAFVIGLAIGLLLQTPHVVLLRIANYATTSVTINAILYLAPVLSLGLLVFFGYAADVKLSLAAGGGLLIVLANIWLLRQRLAAGRQASSAGGNDPHL